jgi:hypothetical protein
MEAVRTSKTSVDNQFTRQYNPEDSSEHQSWSIINVFPKRSAFPYVRKWIPRTISIGVQEIQDLIHELPVHDENVGVWCA